jgi:carbamoyltransferase
MYILGISCFYHDAAAALLCDGELIAAAEEERFSRIKHDSGFPFQAIDFCLRKAEIESADLDHVVFYEKPLLKFDRILKMSLASPWRSSAMFRESMGAWLTEKLWIKASITQHLRLPPEKILFVDHHLSHAASAFFCSPFGEAAVLTIDGVGEWTTTAMGVATANWDGAGQNMIHLSNETRFPHSLGLLYSAFTAFLGFEVNEGEYKVMGMAPYGSPNYQDKVNKLIHIYDDGSFWLDMDYFSYHYSTDRTFNDKFEGLFGKPRDPKSEFITRLTHPHLNGNKVEVERNQYYADVAASIQRVTEEVILKMANHLHRQTGLRKLCFAGGVALNSVANGRILRETPFEEIFIQPAAGDSGGALGAALYAYHVVLGKRRRFVMEHAYWGESYSDSEVQNFLEQRNIKYQRFEQEDRLIARVVDDLTGGKVVGWFQGAFEWGPRALGNRSIIADPRKAEMKDIVNSKIKFREPFRPFAPVILEERANEFFSVDAVNQYPARYMLLVLPLRENKYDIVPAVNHLGTGRLQLVRADWNSRYYGVVQKFGEATGVPVLMNTSFNLRGEPIVSSPTNAFNTFVKSGLDTLVMNDYVILKQDLKVD